MTQTCSDYRIDALSRRVDSLDRRFNELEHRMDKGFRRLEARFGPVEKRFIQIEGRIEAVRSDQTKRLNNLVDGLMIWALVSLDVVAVVAVLVTHP